MRSSTPLDRVQGCGPPKGEITKQTHRQLQCAEHNEKRAPKTPGTARRKRHARRVVAFKPLTPIPPQPLRPPRLRSESGRRPKRVKLRNKVPSSFNLQNITKNRAPKTPETVCRTRHAHPLLCVPLAPCGRGVPEGRGEGRPQADTPAPKITSSNHKRTLRASPSPPGRGVAEGRGEVPEGPPRRTIQPRVAAARPRRIRTNVLDRPRGASYHSRAIAHLF